MQSEARDQQSSLLAHFWVSVLHQSRSDRDKVLVDHLVSRFLIVNELIQSFERITALGCLKVLLLEDLLELLKSPVEYSDGDLVGNYLRGERFLKVRVAGLQ